MRAVHYCRLAFVLFVITHVPLALDCVERLRRLCWLLHSAGVDKSRHVHISVKPNTIAPGVNAALKYFTGLLAVCIRERLTTRAHKLYMERMNYYKANHVGDTLENTDQLICEDIEKFSSAFAGLCLLQSLKPIVDFILFSFKMGQYMGIEGPLGMYTWFIVAVAISAKVAPRYGKLAAAEQTLEGRFRARHARSLSRMLR